MNKEQFETIINKVDFFKDDNGNIDYNQIIIMLENHIYEYRTEQLFNQFLDAEYEVLKGGV